jgi:hypothetical protein
MTGTLKFFSSLQKLSPCSYSRLLRERWWKLYDEGQFGRSGSGQGGVEYMEHLERPDE